MYRTHPKIVLTFAAAAVLAALALPLLAGTASVQRRVPDRRIVPPKGPSGYGPVVFVADVVPGSPAERAGLRKGDIIRALDSLQVTDEAALADQIASLDPGSHRLDIERRAETLSLTIDLVDGSWGATASSGILVGPISSETQAWEEGLRPGDLITNAGGGGFAGLESTFKEQMIKKKKGPVNVAVYRAAGGGPETLSLDQNVFGTYVMSALRSVAVAMNRARMGRSPEGSGIDTGTAMAASKFGLSDSASRAELERALTPASYTPSPSVRRRIEEFNVLTHVFVDPQTGEVVLFGEYNPRYPTGPIAYRDLLSDALRNAYPAFSLVNAAGDQTNQRVAKTIDTDLTKVGRDEAFAMRWMERLLQPLLNSQAPTIERQLMERRLKKVFGISAEDFAIHWNWAQRKTERFDSEQQYRISKSVVGKVMAKAGVPETIGQGYMAVKWMHANPSPEAAIDAYTLLGTIDSYYDLRDQRMRNEISTERATILLAAAAYEPILRGIKVPEPEIRRLIDGLRAGSVTQETILNRINPRWDEMAVRALVDHVFHGFRFSNAYLSHMYSLPAVLSGVDLYGNLPDSQIMRAFFEADYVLKYVTSAAPGWDGFPDGVTFHQYLVDKIAGSGSTGKLPTTGVNRYWIGPGRVEIEDLGRASGVRFKSASVRIQAEPLEQKGGDSAGAKYFRAALDEYASNLTSNYEDLAREYPSLHVVREAEKVIALARWLKSRGLAPVLADARPAPRPVPDKVEGFWGLTYLSNPQGDTDTIVFWMQGGVSFEEKEGEGWIGVAADPGVERDTLHQLAASVALVEKASAAALGGDLESARDLAEKSALAMTGRIDLQALPVPVPVPVDEAIAGLPSAAGQAAVSMAAIEAVEATAAALAQARTELTAAEAGKASDPVAYERALAASRASEQSSRENLDKLNRLLVAYRQAPVSVPDAVVTIAGLRPAAVERGTAGPTAGPRPISSPVDPLTAGEQAQFAARSPSWMAEIRNGIADRLTKINPRLAAIGDIIRSEPKILPVKRFNQLEPGDVLLVEPERGDFKGNVVAFSDRLSSLEFGEGSSFASHTFIYLKTVDSKKLFLDNNPNEGFLIKNEDQILKQYGNRHMDVAEPLKSIDAEKLYAAARTKALEETKNKERGLIDTTNYGIFGDDMVCSEASRWALIQAGYEVPETGSWLKKAIRIYFGPANFYTEKQYFLISTLVF